MLDWRYTVGERVSDGRAQEGEAHGFEARERGAVRDGRGRELAPSARCALREGGHARNWALFIIAGSERGKSGKATQMPNSLTWPYVRMPFVVTRRRGRRSLPKRLMLMKTARFLAGWGARGVGHLCFAARHRCFPRYAGPGIPPRRYAARRFSPLVVPVAKQKQPEGFFYAVVQGGRESLIQGRCVPNGRFPHLYHGGDIRPLQAEYSEPSKGRGEEVTSHLSAPRETISARGSRGQRLPQVSPRACGTTPTSPFF